jgi:hypothetical protein
MIQRFGLLVFPDITPEFRYIDEPVDEEVLARVQRTFRRLDKLNPERIGAERSSKGVPVLKFNPQAQKAFRRWHESRERRFRSGGLLPALISHLKKYAKLVPALALLFHLIDGKKGAIQLPEVKRAIAWSRFLEAHAVRAYGAVIRADVTGAKTILDHIAKGDLETEFSARDVDRKKWSGLTDLKKDVDPALRVLEECNIIRGRKKGKGFVYDINPKVLKAARRSSAR